METAGRDKDREGEGEGSHMGAGQTWNVGWHCPCWPRRGSSGARQGVQKAGVCKAGDYSRHRHSAMENLPPPLEEHIPGTCHARAVMPPHCMWPARPSPRDVSWCRVQAAAFLSTLGCSDTGCVSLVSSAFSDFHSPSSL